MESSFTTGSTRIDALTDDRLFESCGARIAFTGRRGGVSSAPYASLNLGAHVGDDLRSVGQNRLAVLEAFGALGWSERLVVPNQVHGSRVVAVGSATELEQVRIQAEEGADAVVCTAVDVPVLLCFADCVPVVLVAPGGAFAVVHSGWRGTIAQIAGKALHALAAAAGVEEGSCNAYIGPHIGPCCYEVSGELLERFGAAFGSGCVVEGKLDLGACVAASLQGAGARPERITDSGVCTSCESDSYYSYRASGGQCGRHGAYAHLEGE